MALKTGPGGKHGCWTACHLCCLSPLVQVWPLPTSSLRRECTDVAESIAHASIHSPVAARTSPCSVPSTPGSHTTLCHCTVAWSYAHAVKNTTSVGCSTAFTSFWHVELHPWPLAPNNNIQGVMGPIAVQRGWMFGQFGCGSRELSLPLFL